MVSGHPSRVEGRPAGLRRRDRLAQLGAAHARRAARQGRARRLLDVHLHQLAAHPRLRPRVGREVRGSRPRRRRRAHARVPVRAGRRERPLGRGGDDASIPSRWTASTGSGRRSRNHYWPAVYFADAGGRIRHHHFGEGGYDECERSIQLLLREAGGKTSPTISCPSPTTASRRKRTGRTWIARDVRWLEQAQNFASPGFAGLDDPHEATPCHYDLHLNQWALPGDWTIGRGASVVNGAGGGIVFRFHARDVNLVLGPPAREDDRAVPRARRRRAARRRARPRLDARAGPSTEQRLYQLFASRARSRSAPSRSRSSPPASRPTCSPSANSSTYGTSRIQIASDGHPVTTFDEPLLERRRRTEDSNDFRTRFAEGLRVVSAYDTRAPLIVCDAVPDRWDHAARPRRR